VLSDYVGSDALTRPGSVDGVGRLRRPLLTGVLLIAACGSHSTTPPLDHLADGTISLSHRSLHPVALHGEMLIASPVIGNPRHLVVQGSGLWIADHSGDPYLHLVDLRTGQLVLSRGQHGEGPGDFGESPQFSLRPGDEVGIWAYDARLRRLTREGSDPTSGYVIVPTPERQVESVWSYGWLGRNRLVGVGDLDTNRLMFADTTGRLLAMVRSDLLGPDSVSLEARRAVSSGFSACAVPAAHRLAVLFQLGGRIDIHDTLGRLLVRAKVPFPSDGEWAMTRRGRVWAQANWFYYLDCAGSANYLYALFGGHRTDGPGGGQTRAARYVHVFDWDGNLVAVLGLDHEMSTIATAGDTMLYAAGQETQGVYSYRLPPLGHR
jgi:hypothetical protein